MGATLRQWMGKVNLIRRQGFEVAISSQQKNLTFSAVNERMELKKKKKERDNPRRTPLRNGSVGLLVGPKLLQF